MADSKGKGLIILGALLAGVSIVAMASSGNKSPVRRLRVKSLDRRRQTLTYLVEFKNLDNEPDTLKEFTVPVQRERIWQDFHNHTVMAYGDPDRSTIGVDLFGENGATAVYRLMIDFVRNEMREIPL